MNFWLNFQTLSFERIFIDIRELEAKKPAPSPPLKLPDYTPPTSSDVVGCSQEDGGVGAGGEWMQLVFFILV